MANKNETAAVEPAQKFTLSQLQKYAYEVFGVTPSKVAGATANLPEGEYTIDEIRKVLEDWSKKEAK